MLNKSLSFAALILSMSMLNAVNFKPTFEDNYIKVVAKHPRCGSFTITPKKGAVTGIISLEAHKFESDTIGGSNFSSTMVTGYLDKLPDAGRKFRYDWAGSGAQDHYRIYCKTKRLTTELGDTVPCSSVVDIKSTAHNDACNPDNITGVGISAADGYKDLNMNQG